MYRSGKNAVFRRFFGQTRTTEGLFGVVPGVNLMFFKLWACSQDDADIFGIFRYKVQARITFLVFYSRRATYWWNGQKLRFLVISAQTGAEHRGFINGRGVSFWFSWSFCHVAKTWQIFVAQFLCRYKRYNMGIFFFKNAQKGDLLVGFLWKMSLLAENFAAMGGIRLFNILTRKQDQEPMVL